MRDINPLQCGEQECEPSHSFGPCARSFHLLHYVFSGTGQYHSPNGSHQVEKGQIFVIRPGEITTYTADDKNPWHYSWVGFDCAVDLGSLFEADIIEAPECARIFNDFMRSGRMENGRELYICGKIYELLALLSTREGHVGNRASRYAKMAQNYIETHLIQELRVNKLAASLNLDRAYFSKIFRKHTGKSPQRYIVDLRLDKAAELLAYQDVAPGEAAQLVGYTDIYNFSRMFKRRFGTPPSAYRGNRKDNQKA
jgi:AraC-like DNA-binding protein